MTDEAENIGSRADETEGLMSPLAETTMTVPTRRALVRTYWAELVFGSTLALYAILAVFAYRYAYFSWDLRLANWIQTISLPGFDVLMIGTSRLGDGWIPFALVTTAAALLMIARLKPEALVCVTGVATGALFNRILKDLISRPRPTDDLVRILTEYRHESFPSGHVVFFVEFFGLLFFLSYVLLKRGVARRLALMVTGLLVSLIGVSRVYLGAHWPSDVVGAYLAGGIWLMLMIEFYRRLKARQDAN